VGTPSGGPPKLTRTVRCRYRNGWGSVRSLTAKRCGNGPGLRMGHMKKAVKKTSAPDMLDEYDFSKGVRGKYAKRYGEGTNIVILAPDVAEFFPDSQ